MDDGAWCRSAYSSPLLRVAVAGYTTAVCLLAPVPASAAADPIGAALNDVAVVRTPTGVGAAFSVGAKRFLTAAHVVTGAENPELFLNNGRRLSGRVLNIDRHLDLALLGTDQAVDTLRLRNGAVRVGEDVFAVGAPLGELSVSRGIVSGMRSVDGFEHVQTDAAVNGGNSGGPLLDARGRVLGVIVSKFAKAEGMAMAVPVSRIKSFMNGRSHDDAMQVADRGIGASHTPARSNGSQMQWLALPLLGFVTLILFGRPRLRRRRPITVELDR